MPGMPWTIQELRRLRDLYPVLPWRELMQAFYPRSWDAIRCQASDLGLHKLKKPGRPPPAFKRRDWRAIANAHKPRIVLAQPVPAERP
jgi:hypothetical protein